MVVMMWTVREVAMRTGLKEPHIRKLAREGLLPYVKIGKQGGTGRIMFEADDIMRFIKDHKVTVYRDNRAPATLEREHRKNNPSEIVFNPERKEEEE